MSDRTNYLGDRAQTTIDFAVGISVFLLAVAFVFAILPGTLDPLLDSAQEETVAVDRVADHLAKQALATPSNPYVLNLACTTYFFGGPSASDCGFSGDNLHDRLGLRDDIEVNVQLLGDGPDDDSTPDVLCNDGAGNVGEKGDLDTCSTEFSAGDSPDETGSIMVARRVVSISGIDATMRVRAW